MTLYTHALVGLGLALAVTARRMPRITGHFLSYCRSFRLL
jgi:hypothetical protein